MKLTNTAPPYCSICFSQKLNQPHIDCEVYWDGPVIDSGNGMKQPIDDMIVCLDCGKRIGVLAGMVEPSEDTDKDEAMKAELGQLRALRARNAKKLAAIKKALGDE